MATREQAEQLASEARTGRFREILPALLEIAHEPGGDRDAAMTAAGAAISILQWLDRFDEAADLAEELIVQDGPLGGHLCDQDVPFCDAFLSAALYGTATSGAEPGTGEPEAAAASRLARVGAFVAPDREMGSLLRETAERLEAGETIAGEFEFYFAWSAPVLPSAGVIGGDRLECDPTELDPEQLRVFWSALHQTRDLDRAKVVHRATGKVPADFNLCLWLAGAYALGGEVESAEEVLIEAQAGFWPLMHWHVLPDAIVQVPTLRSVATDRVREYYLTHPIGPEARLEN